MKPDFYPLLFEPVYKDYIWGGDRIPRLFHRQTDQEVIAESWEIADRPEGMSVVSNGPLSGASLNDLVKESPGAVVGSKIPDADVFPLLIKIIDAKERLSVQVHPNDETAASYGGEAKTESWYALEGGQDSNVFAGFNREMARKDLDKAIEEETLEDVLHSIPMKSGDAIYIPGGRVHAIAEGCLLLEVQQNSNTTYRVYDWGRLGKDGKPRELHVEQALQVIDWKDVKPVVVQPRKERESAVGSCWKVIDSPYFHISRLDLAGREDVLNDGSSFHVLFVVAGAVGIEGYGVSVSVGAGTSCLLPAALAEYSVTPSDGSASVIRITL